MSRSVQMEVVWVANVTVSTKSYQLFMFHATAVPSDTEHACVDIQNETSHSNTSYLVLVFSTSSIKKNKFP